MGWDSPDGNNARNEYYGAHSCARSCIDLEGVWELEIEHEFEFEPSATSYFA
jgi:hypothetical protein